MDENIIETIQIGGNKQALALPSKIKLLLLNQQFPALYRVENNNNALFLIPTGFGKKGSKRKTARAGIIHWFKLSYDRNRMRITNICFAE